MSDYIIWTGVLDGKTVLKRRGSQGENNTRFIGCQELKGAIAFHPAFNELKCQIVLIEVESKIVGNS